MYEKMIINLIRLQGPLSKADIAAAIGLSITAVTKYINSMLEEGMISEIKSAKSSGGRIPVLYDIEPGYGYCAAFDFGQGTFRAGVFDARNRLLAEKSIESRSLGDHKKGVGIIVSELRALIEKASPKGNLLGVGAAISGIINHEKGLCCLIPNLPGWENVELGDLLEEEFGAPAYIDDSARLGALYHSARKQGRERNLIYISAGIGIGMGIVMDWALFRGKSGAAGEIGHIIVKPDGLQCGCGNKGCLEQYSSVPAMTKRIVSSINAGVSSLITDYTGNDPSKIDGFVLQKALKNMDKLTYNIVMEAGYYLGYCLSQIVTLFNPSIIIIGGGGVSISDDMITESIKAVNRFAISQSFQDVSIMKADPSVKGELHGASLSVLDKHFGLDYITKSSGFLDVLFGELG